ncbi:MAG: hypothetical protein JNJ82_18280 [Opitutaceae bacterium]|nr:hypothetical protein [Opitutaceae bacterium]
MTMIRSVFAALLRHPSDLPSRLSSLAGAALMLASASAQQVAPPASPTTEPKPVPVQLQIAPQQKSADNEVVVLNPFEVNTDKDDGFVATNAGSATKLGLDMADMSAAYSVMTGEFIEALGITDLKEAILWSTNGSPVFDGQGADLFNIPSLANVRGVGLHTGQQRDFFLTGSISDTYNTERIEFGRGPNAVLFNVGANDALGGGISFVGKRARFDRDSTNLKLTTGSWDYYRTEIDVNQRLTERFALRLNLLGHNRGGYIDGEFEDRYGITLAGTYRFRPRTELRFEVSYDYTERSNPGLGLYDNLSGWDGSTTFNGRLTNAMFSGNATPGTVYGLTFNGEPQGVNRETSNRYIYDPTSGTIMNWIHTAMTRRGDDTNRTPIYLDGVTRWTRDGNAFLLPVNNGGGSGGNTRTPGMTAANGGQAPFYYANGLPDTRFNRQINGSSFRVPGPRQTISPDEPLFTQKNAAATLGFTHQMGDKLFFDVGANFTRTANLPVNHQLGMRTLAIDLNRTLPNGATNPNYLQAYSQADPRYYKRTTDNGAIRANAAYITDLGKWGNYTFSFTLGGNIRDTVHRQYIRSVALATDPREWAAQTLTMRYYLNNDFRSFIDSNATSLYDVLPLSGGNSGYTTSNVTVRPRWVLNDWYNQDESTLSAIFAFAGKYFNNRLVVTPGIRLDRQTTYRRNRPTNAGFLPSDPNWDGVTLTDAYWRPDAPDGWLTMRLGNRPTSGGVNSVNPANPVFNGIPFRNDYNAPEWSKDILAKNVGATYHLFKWASLKLNWADSYKPSDAGRLQITGEFADPETGTSYEGGLTMSFFGGRLIATPRYYWNNVDNLLGDPPTTSPINTLIGSKAWNEPSASAVNPFDYAGVPGQDAFSRTNKGVELELVGRITKAWRLSASFGNAERTDYDRWQNTQAYVSGRANEFKQVLEAAGGRLDTSGSFSTLQSPSAPGYAVADPAITNAMITAAGGNTTTRTNAVTAYNNIWTQYDVISTLKDTVGLKRFTVNLFTDYAIQTGRLKGLRAGLGVRFVDKDIAGYRSGDSIANPAFNAALPVSATNTPYIDDPAVDANTPVWIKRPWEATLTLDYTRRLKSGWRYLDGKEATVRLIIRNLTNNQMVSYQDDGVVLRAPNGDYSLGYREAVPGRLANFQRPINFELTVGLNL